MTPVAQDPRSPVDVSFADVYHAEEASAPFLSKPQPSQPKQRPYVPKHWPWMLSTVILAVACTVLLGRSIYHPLPQAGSYEAGFATDLDAAISVLQIEERKFTGGLHWDDNGTLIRNPLPGGREWVGPPSPEIDALWQHVVDAGGVDLSGKEADMVRGKTRQRLTGEYIAGLDVFHQLHCLDRLRKSLYPDYYHDPDGKEIEILHNEHCVDYLRQATMCNSDMTVLRLVYSPSADRWSPDFEGTHTCRNFDKLLSWSLDRLNPITEEYWRSGKGSRD